MRPGEVADRVGAGQAGLPMASRQATATVSDGTVALFDRGGRETGSVTSSGSSSVFAGFRFPPEVISVAVRWYLRYRLSYRDVEELLAERGVTADHVTIYRWVQRFTPEFVEAARPCRHAPGDRWFVDETGNPDRRSAEPPGPAAEGTRRRDQRVLPGCLAES
jgi:hypothetical protein